MSCSCQIFIKGRLNEYAPDVRGQPTDGYGSGPEYSITLWEVGLDGYHKAKILWSGYRERSKFIIRYYGLDFGLANRYAPIEILVITCVAMNNLIIYDQ